MKNLFKMMAVAAVAVMAMVSCEPKPQPEPEVVAEITVTPANVVLTAAAPKEQKITVKATKAWTAETKATWLSLSAVKGEGNAEVTIKADENVAAAGQAAPTREAEIVFTCEDKKATVKVSQSEEGLVFSLDKESAEVPAEGATVEVKVSANAEFTVTIPEEVTWITNGAVKAAKDDVVTLVVAANASTQSREAQVAIACGGQSKNVKVSQAGIVKVSQIKTADDFATFAAASASYEATETVTLEADITLPAAQVNVDTLRCNFDGKGHTITWSKAPVTDAEVVDVEGWMGGVFSVVNPGLEIKNLKAVATVAAVEKNYKAAKVGGIAGVVLENCKITSCEATVDFELNTTSAAHVGGICGDTREGTVVENCKSAGSIKNTETSTVADQFGGIIGQARNVFTVKDCSSSATLSYLGSTTPRFGGMIGYVDDCVRGLVKGCTYSGTILHKNVKIGNTSYHYLGGIIGYFAQNKKPEMESYVIEDCVFSGKIQGIIGDATNEVKSRYAGIVPQVSTPAGNKLLTIKGCRNEGVIDVEFTVAPKAKAVTQVGGIFGFAEKDSQFTIENCTMAGTINVHGVGATATNSIGGIYANHTLADCKVVNCVVSGKASISAPNVTNYVGVVGGTPGGVLAELSCKVAAIPFVKKDVDVTINAENLPTYAFGKAGVVTDLTGVTFGE